MRYTDTAVSCLISFVQTKGVDSTGRDTRTLKEADLIASQLILQLLHDPLLAERVQEIADDLRYAVRSPQ